MYQVHTISVDTALFQSIKINFHIDNLWLRIEQCIPFNAFFMYRLPTQEMVLCHSKYIMPCNLICSLIRICIPFGFVNILWDTKVFATTFVYLIGHEWSFLAKRCYHYTKERHTVTLFDVVKFRLIFDMYFAI